MSHIPSILPAPRKEYEVYSDALEQPAARGGAGGQYAAAGAGRPGSKPSLSTAIVPASIDSETGKPRFDAIVLAQHPGQVVHTQFSALVEKNAAHVIRERPSEQEEAAAASRTKAALESIVNAKIATARTTHVPGVDNSANRAEQSKFIRYTASEDTQGFTQATQQRVVRMVEAQVDPLEPSKFKHKKMPQTAGEAPVPILHSPPKKLTAADQEAWTIPSAISNWKNARGYVIPLDKRLAADGRSLLEPTVNDNFAKLSEALLIAERKARVEVETRAAIQKKLALKEKEAKEQELRELAARARMERGGIANLQEKQSAGVAVAGLAQYAGGASSAGGAVGAGRLVDYGSSSGAGGGGGGGRLVDYGSDSEGEEDAGGRARQSTSSSSLGGAQQRGGAGGAAVSASSDFEGAPTHARTSAAAEQEVAEDAAARQDRERQRKEHLKEKEREMRLAGTKRGRDGQASGLDDSERERDISEKVALGLPIGRGAAGGGESLYDSRLFNQSEGVGSGFGGEEEYNVYSKAWRSDTAAASIYRPGRGGAGGAQLSGEEAEAQIKDLREGAGAKFKPHTDFEGVDRSAGGGGGGGPVQFEKAGSAFAAGAGAGGAAGDSADPFGLDAMLTETKRGRGLDGIGKGRPGGAGGYMAVAGGGAGGRSAADLAAGSGRDSIKFRSAGLQQ